jgi:Rrf2 family protein
MITKKTEYAIRALSELALNPEDRLTANVVAQRQGIPPKYLPQIVSELTQAGLVRSVRGYGGGIRLNRSPDQISLLSIIEAIQGRIKIFDCEHHAIGCAVKGACGLNRVYGKALAALEDVFREAVLSDIQINHPIRGKDD